MWMIMMTFKPFIWSLSIHCRSLIMDSPVNRSTILQLERKLVSHQLERLLHKILVLGSWTASFLKSVEWTLRPLLLVTSLQKLLALWALICFNLLVRCHHWCNRQILHTSTSSPNLMIKMIWCWTLFSGTHSLMEQFFFHKDQISMRSSDITLRSHLMDKLKKIILASKMLMICQFILIRNRMVLLTSTSQWVSSSSAKTSHLHSHIMLVRPNRS